MSMFRQKLAPIYLAAISGLITANCSSNQHTYSSERFNTEFIRDTGAGNADREAAPPYRSLGERWRECALRIERIGLPSDGAYHCETWTYGRVSSKLIAIRGSGLTVPIVETSLIHSEKISRRLIHLTGGTGGEVLQVYPPVSESIRIKINNLGGQVSPNFEDLAFMNFITSGHTIVSIGYPGTTMRTTKEYDEIRLSIKEVRSVFEFYTDKDGTSPAIISESLGNHILLGALGLKKLETVDFLAISPSMNGIQYALNERRENFPTAHLWKDFYVWSRRSNSLTFKAIEKIDVASHIEKFSGGRVLSWRFIEPKSDCSRILLASEDYRVPLDLLKSGGRHEKVYILSGDHNLLADSAITESYIVNFSNCINGIVNKK